MKFPSAPVFVALALAMNTSCDRAPRVHEIESVHADAAPSYDALREASRATVSAHCGDCHDGSKLGIPKALRIFDVVDPDWSHKMSAAQLEEAARRVDDPLELRRGSDPVESTVTKREREAFRAYVKAEIERREKKANGG